MKESNFIYKQNIDKVARDNTHEENSEDLKEKLRELSENISKYSPETKEFFEIKESFIKIQPAVESEIREYIKREESLDISFSINSGYGLYFKLINQLNLLTESDKELGAKLFMLSDDMDHAITNDILKKRDIYKSEEKNINQDDYLSGFILKKLAFSEDEISDLIKSWLSIEDDYSVDWYIRQGLRNIRGLENFEKNSVKYLYDNFGIRGFGRYRMRELKTQYEERDNMGPYGLFFQAVMDHNGSFIQSNQSEYLREQVEENSIMLRVIEANGKIDLAKRLLFLRDKYEQKIKFMYMHVHGNTDVIGLGDRPGNNRKFTQEDLKGNGVQRIKELFEDNAELILFSCLTGVKGGLAEEMANTYNVKVIASDKPTEGEPKLLEIKKNAAGDNLEFNIIFNTDDEYDKDINQTKKGTVIYNSNN